MKGPVTMLTDANVFLRFLFNDQPQESAAAKQLFEEAAAGTIILRVPEIMVAEIFYSLTSAAISRQLAAKQLSALFHQCGIDLENRQRVFTILNTCEAKDIDYSDAAMVVASLDTTTKMPILTSNPDFSKTPEITAFSPIDWLQKRRKFLHAAG